MAASKSYHRYLSIQTSHNPITTDPVFDLDESDVWNVTPSPDSLHPIPHSRISKTSLSVNRSGEIDRTASSLPVNVPDWSKILKQDYSQNRRNCDFSDSDEFEAESDGGRIPPHEMVAKTRVASFSVHEGIGRTLKGRDLSRVRNAIWEKIGFED